MAILYFLIIFGATFTGAMAGLGGGLFIRPLFDLISYHNALTISFFSSTAITTMAITNIIKKVRQNVTIQVKIVLIIAFGAILGGFVGNILLEATTNILTNTQVLILHAVLTIAVVSGALFITGRFQLKNPLTNPLFAFPIGLLTGVVGTYLGLGGGIMNIPLLTALFGFGLKDATTNSIAVIFFSHTSRIITLGFTVGYAYFDLHFLLFIIPAAILGGFFGATLSKRLKERHVRHLFQGSLTFVILMNLFNLVRLLVINY